MLNAVLGRALSQLERPPITIDVAQFRGDRFAHRSAKARFYSQCDGDRSAWRFTAIIDPLGGLDDLYAKRLRRCSESSIADDPVRMLRAVRTSITHNLLIEPATCQDLKQHSAHLSAASPERIRDEFINILAGRKPAAALDILSRLNLLSQIVPEVTVLSSIEQRPPHQHNVWQHTLAVIGHLDTMLQVINPQRDEHLTANAQLIAWTLNSLRPPLQKHLARTWANQRPHRALLMLAALLHDVGKAETRSVTEDGRVHFYEHERLGARLAEKRADALRLSRHEIERVTTIVREHMRPHWLASAQSLTTRAVYRFWRSTGDSRG